MRICLQLGTATLLLLCVFLPVVVADNTNLVPFPTGWVTDTPWGYSVPSSYYGIYHETSVTYNGAYTFRIHATSANGVGGADYYKVDISPEDVVYMSAVIKTGGTIGDRIPFSGVRIGLDFYEAGDGYRNICGASSNYDASMGCSDQSSSTYYTMQDANYVKWGSDWTNVSWTFTVPDYVTAGSWGAFTEGTQHVPAFIIVWFQMWSYGPTSATQYPNGCFDSYISDFNVYVNPESIPDPTPTPTPPVTPYPSPTSNQPRPETFNTPIPFPTTYVYPTQNWVPIQIGQDLPDSGSIGILVTIGVIIFAGIWLTTLMIKVIKD